MEGICFIMARAKPQFSRLGRERLGIHIWLEPAACTALSRAKLCTELAAGVDERSYE